MSNALSTVANCEEENLFDKYRSRPKQLARWLLQSRDTLRTKYQKLKADWKRLTVRVNDVSNSRDKWKQRAEVSDTQVQSMQAEVERLSALLEQAADSDSKKSSPRRLHGCRSRPDRPRPDRPRLGRPPS
ncbi:MAG: hypothetical protein IH899_04895 [Planctomycetes bacterium]|nr:hypothetical protein [Planctomycetota bacterium]